MKTIPQKLKDKLIKREKDNSIRKLGSSQSVIDFSSNDYLGYAKSKGIYSASKKILYAHSENLNGSTGSRLLSGNNKLYTIAEKTLSEIHNSESALIFNSGYDANLGLLSAVLQRNDIIYFDEFIHASIRDGLQLSKAKSYKFKHNNLDDLNQKINSTKSTDGQCYIITESVFSMDGDSPDLIKLVELAKTNDALLIIDEAHAIGVLGSNGLGIIQDLGIEQNVFARIVTFGKALGCHGAVILCNLELRNFLINFARSFIYTTALPPHSIATIIAAYEELSKSRAIEILNSNIQCFKSELHALEIVNRFIPSISAIQSCMVKGNDKTKRLSAQLKASGFDVKPILYPTVAEGYERLRFCIHAYNTETEIRNVLKALANFELSDKSSLNER